MTGHVGGVSRLLNQSPLSMTGVNNGGHERGTCDRSCWDCRLIHTAYGCNMSTKVGTSIFLYT